MALQRYRSIANGSWKQIVRFKEKKKMIELIIHNCTVLSQVSYRSQSSENGCHPTTMTNCDYKVSYEAQRCLSWLYEC